MKVGSLVQIVDDEFPELIGVIGRVTRFSDDNTTAVVQSQFGMGMWCSLSNLVEVYSNEDLG